MSAMQWHKELQSLNNNPNFPFANKLRELYNVEVPAGAPKYQVEYLYKYCRQADLTGNSDGLPLVQYAAKKSAELWARFPWLTKKYDTVVIQKVEKTNAGKSEKAELPDGTIIFCEKRGKYLMYLGGTIQVRASTVEKAKQIAQKKLNFSGPFIE